jgi:OmpA-OmpF porin, OOP family
VPTKKEKIMFKKNVFLGLVLGSVAISAAAESNFSGEVLLGIADQKLTAEDFSTSGDDTSFGVRGAFQLSKNFALEVAYRNNGETSDKYVDDFGDNINDMLSSTELNLGVKAIIPVSDVFSFNGRLGFSMWDAKVEETDSAFPGETFKASDDGNDLYYGVGIQYSISSKVFIGAEYLVTKMEVSDNGVSGDFDVENMSLSLGFKF